MTIPCILILWGLAGIQASRAETPSVEEMWETIQQQQKLIAVLKARLDDTDQRVTANEAKVEEATEEVEAAAEAFETAQTSMRGSSWADRTTIGGYGELHYNNREGDDEVDFHRFILYFGHEFTENIRFFSELELEHALAGEGKSGEVELEQAWIEADITDHHRLRVGLDILPVGLVSYNHEPNTFYGVERPEVEVRIIPSTWWEAGIGLNGELAPGWNYDAVLHSGLSTTTNIRSGRQKVSEANADHPAVTARLRYTGIPGLEVGGSFQYQSDITAGVADNSATLFEGHVDWKHRTGLGLRALYTRWDLDDVLSIAGDDTQYGYYIEPAYRFPLGFISGEVGVFARWSELDYGNTKEEERIGFGINYWPIDQVAFKFDWINIDDVDADTSADTFNLGLAYQF
ncbi:MAG: porin [Proteobacteria bacterium]|nr:porin [Pseudomonadota bacterium]